MLPQFSQKKNRPAARREKEKKRKREKEKKGKKGKKGKKVTESSQHRTPPENRRKRR